MHLQIDRRREMRKVAWRFSVCLIKFWWVKVKLLRILAAQPPIRSESWHKSFCENTTLTNSPMCMSIEVPIQTYKHDAEDLTFLKKNVIFDNSFAWLLKGEKHWCRNDLVNLDAVTPSLSTHPHVKQNIFAHKKRRKLSKCQSFSIKIVPGLSKIIKQLLHYIVFLHYILLYYTVYIVYVLQIELHKCVHINKHTHLSVPVGMVQCTRL